MSGDIPGDRDPTDDRPASAVPRPDVDRVAPLARRVEHLGRGRLTVERSLIHRLVQRPAIGCEDVAAWPSLKAPRAETVLGERLPGAQDVPEIAIENENRRSGESVQSGVGS